MPSDTNPPLSPDSTRLYSAVDRSNESYEPSPHAPRRTIPSGRVSPDGKRAWPQSSMTTKIIVFGGMGVAAAAATAGAVLAVRTVVDAIAGSDEDDAVEAARQRARRSRPAQQFGPRPSPTMRFADTGRTDHDSRADRDRQDRDRADRERMERMRREADRRRKASSSSQSQGSVVDSVNETVASVTSGVRDVLDAVTAAIEGFRSVAEKAGGVMADFNKAADQVKSMIEPMTQQTRPRSGSHARPAKKDMVDLRDDKSGAQDTGAQDARSHRL